MKPNIGINNSTNNHAQIAPASLGSKKIIMNPNTTFKTKAVISSTDTMSEKSNEKYDK